MALYNTVSIGAIIAKIYRDLNLEDSNFINDAIEWSGEAIEHIGAYNQLVRKEAVLEVTSYKVGLPSDLYSLLQVSYAPGDGIDTDNFKDKAKYPLPASNATIHNGIHSGTSGGRPVVWEESYILNPNFIHFTFEEGVVGLSYMAINLDDNGYPTIPDDISYKEAVTWYIIQKLMLGGYKHIDPSLTFFTSRQLWLQYCSQARNKAMMQDLGDLERFKNNWVRLVGSVDTSFNFFREQYITAPIGSLYGNEHIDISLP